MGESDRGPIGANSIRESAWVTIRDPTRIAGESMIRSSKFLSALAILVALVSSAAQSAERKPESIESLTLGEQVAGSLLTADDLEGRVVLAYAWCVS